MKQQEKDNLHGINSERIILVTMYIQNGMAENKENKLVTLASDNILTLAITQKIRKLNQSRK